MKGHQGVLFVTTSIILFLTVDAGFLRSLAEKVERESGKLEVSEPILSHKFSDYDTNEDGFIGYEEFVSFLMKEFTIENPEDMRPAYSAADIDDDGRLNEEEFADFPLHDSATEGEIEERGCRRICKIGCRRLIFKCYWSCQWHC